MKKQCDKGKSCGSTCIEREKDCLLELGPNLGLPFARKSIEGRSKTYTLSPSVTGYAGNQLEIKGILNELREEGNLLKTDGVVKESDIKWGKTLGSGVTDVGGGLFGNFSTILSEQLLGEKKEGIPRMVGVKTGKIGPDEVKAIKIVGENDLGPKLLGSRVSSKVEKDLYGYPVSTGVIAMTKVPAITYSRFPESSEVLGTKSDMYWRAVAGLHRLGIAHNDMHSGNVFVDSQGKARFVDFGLAQVLPKAALAEALGSIYGGNWQFSASAYDGLAKVVRSNLPRIEQFLVRKGLDSDEIGDLLTTSIRNNAEFYGQGVWKRLSDNDAKKLIEIFYEGL